MLNKKMNLKEARKELAIISRLKNKYPISTFKSETTRIELANFVRVFSKQEIENLLKEIKKEFEDEEDWMEMHKCENRFESERRFGFSKAINYFVKIAEKKGFNVK
jgi:hypothetical protein